MKFKPLHDRVLIEVLDSSEKTAGGIIIPDSAQEKPQEGKVVAVGGGSKTEDRKIKPKDLKDGDKVKKVSFGDTTGLSIKRDDPARRKSFRARHNCDNPGPKTKARYWSCYQWRAGAKVNN